jgi:hypothetical protein
MNNENENLLEEAMEPTQEESEEVKECGQPLDVSKLPYTREHDYIISRTTGAAVEVSFGPQCCGNVPANPFASLAQAGYLHSHPEILGKEKLKEFDKASKGQHVPYKVKRK